MSHLTQTHNELLIIFASMILQTQAAQMSNVEQHNQSRQKSESVNNLMAWDAIKKARGYLDQK